LSERPVRLFDVLVELPDRTPVLIRPIRADDKRMLANGLAHLSQTSVQRRFLSPKPQLSRSELRYLTEVDHVNHVALVAEYPGEPVRRLIAVARFVRLPEDPSTAEAAIVVGDDWQHRGLGSLLAQQLAAIARDRGIKRFIATMASDNLPAQRLMQKLTSELRSHAIGDGTSELSFDLPAAGATRARPDGPPLKDRSKSRRRRGASRTSKRS
jgi:RimJ/RimL family protein N-acetyltransferase